MGRVYFLIILIDLICLKSFSQITDTIYFDLEGEIIIKEVASFYRVANFDTLSGNVNGEFRDFTCFNDSLIATGEFNYKNAISIKNYKGDTAHIQRAIRMCELKPSFIRINDYPELRKAIKSKSVDDRLKNGSFKVVEAPPGFPGGMETLSWFISQLIKYPQEAVSNNITGTVRVKFMVDIDGSIKNISVISGIGYGCDEEAIRVMKLIPDWLPGLQQGKPVRTYFSIPIGFIQ